MSDEATKQGIICFQADSGAVIYLKAEGDLVWSVGLEPAIWSFVCPNTEFAKLGPSPGATGSLKFWFAIDISAAADLEIKHCQIIDAEPTVQGNELHGDVPVIIEYRVIIADYRQRFKPPYGGLLVEGTINAQPIKDDLDANGTFEQGNSDILFTLLEKIGLPGGVTNLADVDSSPELKDLKWEHAIAVDELDKLLKLWGCVFVPHPDGYSTIEQIGSGTRPVADATQPVPVFDRRGNTIVVVGAVVQDKITVTKLGEGGWEFVVQDSEDKWVEIHQADLLTDHGGPLDVLNKQFAGLNQTFKDRVETQLFRCLRLKKTDRILRRNYTDKDESDIIVEAIIAKRSNEGVWASTNEPVRCTVVGLFEAGTILFVRERLVTLPSGSSAIDPPSQFQELTGGGSDLRITYTHEVTDDVTSKPKYFRVGFRQDLGNLIKISDDAQIDAALEGGAMIVSRPDFVQHKLMGADGNLSDLQTAAQTFVKPLLADPNATAEIRTKFGFGDTGLSGRTTEVKITQSGPRMVWKIKPPLSSGLVRALVSSQASLASISTSAGATGYTQPSVPISPSIPSELRKLQWAIKINGAVQDGANFRWTYTGRVVAQTGTAWSGWTNITDADVTAFNGIEAPNGSSGIFGNGIDSANLNGFKLVPIANGTIVPAMRVINGNNAVEYWFSAVNEVDGSCDNGGD